MRVALYQYEIRPDPEENLDKILSVCRELADKNIDLLLLPEVALTGFQNNAYTARLGDPELERLREGAKYLQGQILIGLRFFDGALYNRALVISHRGIEGHYDKRVLFSYWNEGKVFSRGSLPLSFHLGDWQVAPFICYELRFPELFRQQAGAELMLVIANWPTNRLHHWDTLLRARAIENQAYVAGVNRLGRVGSIEFGGASVIFSPLGEDLLHLEAREAVAFADLNLEALREYRKAFPVLEDRLLSKKA